MLTALLQFNGDLLLVAVLYGVDGWQQMACSIGKETSAHLVSCCCQCGHILINPALRTTHLQVG